jgi:hypothetical protein
MAYGGAYTGNFVSNAQNNVPGRPDNTRNWGEGVDPRHENQSYTADYGFPPPEPVVKLRVPSWVEDDMVFIHREPPYFADADTETAQYDDEQQHNTPTLPRGAPDDDKSRQLSGMIHGQQRRIFPYQMSIRVDRDYTTKNETVRNQSLPGSRQDGPLTGFALRAVRGRNSLPVNNPGNPDISFSGNYVRQGWDLYRFTERRMPLRNFRHDKRPIDANLAATAVSKPGRPGPYSSPFPSSPRLNVGAYRPAQRREPGQWDADSVVDYAEDENPEIPLSWGL